ncbi:MAG: hypothetical protein IPG50_14465 [Myxococcales bacterium]|nr:hypothetical protein [Myxococcales bacterium]
MKLGLLALALLAVAGCFSAADAIGETAAVASTSTLSRGPDLTLHALPTADPKALGDVVAVAEAADDYVAFGDHGAVLVRAGAVVQSQGDVRAWRGAAAIPALDGEGTWLVGLSADGRLLRLLESGRFENVGRRLPIASGEHVRGVAVTSDAAFALALDGAVLLVNVAKQTSVRLDVPSLDGVAATESRIAGLRGDELVVVDVASRKATSRAVPGARGAAFDAAGRLLVLTPHALLREDGTSGGTLSRIVERDDVELRALGAGGGRVWFVAGAEPWNLDGESLRRGSVATFDAASSMLVSRSGDVWRAGPALARHRVELSAEEANWNARVLPVAARACGECHGAGRAGLALSSYSAWNANREPIKERVLRARTMPPLLRTLSTEDTRALESFLGP